MFHKTLFCGLFGDVFFARWTVDGRPFFRLLIPVVQWLLFGDERHLFVGEIVLLCSIMLR
jgi:hypothetical protein